MKNVIYRILACVIVLLGIATARANTVTYIMTDVAGSPLVMTDASGNVVRQYIYRPFGEEQILVNHSAAPMNLGFTGKRLDTASDLQYFGARYYDRKNGRFLSLDPVAPVEGDPHLFNRYAYGNNNPYKYTDPDGRHPALVMIAFGLWLNDLATSDEPVSAPWLRGGKDCLSCCKGG